MAEEIDLGEALMHAVMERDHETIVQLAASGIDLDELRNFALDGSVHDYIGPLHAAAHCGDLETMRLLLDLGADPDGAEHWSFESPLLKAMSEGHLDACRLLLERGASANGDWDLHDPHTTSLPVVYAVAHTDTATLKLFHEFGAQMEPAIATGATFDDRLCLHQPPLARSSLGIALAMKKMDAFDCILECGVDINATDDDHCTILHMAMKYFCGHAVKVLLERGACPNIVSSYGGTPLNYAIVHFKGKEFEFVINLLRKHGAELNKINHYVESNKKKQWQVPLLLFAAHLLEFENASQLLRLGALDISDENGVTCMKYISSLCQCGRHNTISYRQFARDLLAYGGDPSAIGRDANPFFNTLKPICERTSSFLSALVVVRRCTEVMNEFAIVDCYLIAYVALSVWQMEHPLLKSRQNNLPSLYERHEEAKIRAKLQWLLKWEDMVKVCQWCRDTAGDTFDTQSENEGVKKVSEEAYLQAMLGGKKKKGKKVKKNVEVEV